MKTNQSPVLAPFGLWNSPLTPETIGQQRRLDEIGWDSDGQTLVWLEGRSDRGVLVAQRHGDAPCDLTDLQSVRGGVGYGGGEFHVSHNKVVFVDRSGQLFTRHLQYERPHPITPAFGSAASPVFSPDASQVLYVFSDGKTDLLALVDASGRNWPMQLVIGADFYMQPAWHPSGEQIAWVEWDHPNMPWDGTRIKLGRLAGSPMQLASETIIAGDENTPVAEPVFSPDGRWLAFIEAEGDWEQLVIYELATGQRRVLLHSDQAQLTHPAWIQGIRTIGWGAASDKIYSIRNKGGFTTLWQVDLNGRSSQIDTSPYTWVTQLAVSSQSDSIAFLASSPSIPKRVVVWDGSSLRVAARSDNESIDPAYFSMPRDLTWKASDGTLVHGLYYAPTNPGYLGAGKPPAILNIHGGPTSQSVSEYQSGIAYYTSRGYAVVEVNYRGSTGYGRTYRDALRGHWGDYDVEDAAGAAQALIDQDLADGCKLVIKGGSAGGYTVLNALIRYPGLFKAGVCLYGVSNLFNLDLDTHKFETHYTHFLVGPLPQAADRYHAWSPVFHADGIKDAIYIFQGSEDKVVLPNQSEDIVEILRKRGTPYKYRLYEGEGHGFRKSQNVADCLKETDRFLQQYVLFAP